MADGPFQRVRRFFAELKRRKVYRVTVTYVVVAAGAVQLVSVVVPASRLPGWSDEFFLGLAVFGFPLAVVLAWAFEVTPEGVRRTKERDGEERGTFGFQWIGLAVAVLAAAGIWYLSTAGNPEPPVGATSAEDSARRAAAAPEEASPPTTIGDRSIAVLPFEALSEGGESETFACGIHDDLLTRLAHVSGLKVISRTAVQKYRGSDLTTEAIADSLNVRWVMEGGVQAMGDQIQVNAQLIDPRSETHAWAESYQRNLTTEDLFALQSEITKRIARSLEEELSPAEEDRVERQPTQDLEAYRLYVRGRSRLAVQTEDGLRAAVDYFRRAIRRDSSYALAWSGLADAVGLFEFHDHASPEGPLPDQERTARRALKLDPDLAEAHASMGFVYNKKQNGPLALRHLKRAVELKPSYAQAHHWLGLLQFTFGRLAPAREHLSLAVDLNPDHAAARLILIWALLAQGELEQATLHARKREPPEAGPSAGEALVLYQSKQWEKLEQLSREALSMGKGPTPAWHFFLARIAALRGDTAHVHERLAQIRRAEDWETRRHYSEGLVHALLGNTEATFAAWKKAEELSRRTWWLRYWFPDLLDPLRDDPRYRKLIRRTNRAWGLNPDGSLPDSVDVSFDSPSDE